MPEIHSWSNISYGPHAEITESNVCSVLYTDPFGP